MKKYVFLAAGVMVTASSAALAQNHGAGTQSNVTVGGIFVPAVSGGGGRGGGGSGGNVTVTTPPTTAVTIRAANMDRNVGGPVNAALDGVVSGGGAQALANLTVQLQGRGDRSAISSGSAAALANAIALLSAGGPVTVQSVVNAVTAWNAAVASMSLAEVRGAYRNVAFAAAAQTLGDAVRTIAEGAIKPQS